MSAMASEITSLVVVYLTVYSGADQRKHQSSASLAFPRGINWRPVSSPHKGSVTRKMFPFDDVIMCFVLFGVKFNGLLKHIQRWPADPTRHLQSLVVGYWAIQFTDKLLKVFKVVACKSKILFFSASSTVLEIGGKSLHFEKPTKFLGYELTTIPVNSIYSRALITCITKDCVTDKPHDCLEDIHTWRGLPRRLEDARASRHGSCY